MPGQAMSCCGATFIHKFCLESWLQSQSTCIFCRRLIDIDIFVEQSRVVLSPVKGADAHPLMAMQMAGSGTISESVKKRRQHA
eukprot:12661509-Ditylum_brightwellii.AAC.1